MEEEEEEEEEDEEEKKKKNDRNNENITYKHMKRILTKDKTVRRYERESL